MSLQKRKGEKRREEQRRVEWGGEE